MEFIPLAFVAGMLTVLAPCVLPVLPVILGGSLGTKNWLKPLVITLSLAGSIVVFTLLLKWSTSLILHVPNSVWKNLAGGIILFFGLIMVFPAVWERISLRTGLAGGSQKALEGANRKQGIIGDILLGASLGPVFASCSPTYFAIIAIILPASFVVGLINLIVYGLGLALVLFLVAFFGQRFIAKAKWAADPHGWFRRGLGILLMLVAIAIIAGLDKKLEAELVKRGFGNTQIEQTLLDKVKEGQN